MPEWMIGGGMLAGGIASGAMGIAGAGQASSAQQYAAQLGLVNAREARQQIMGIFNDLQGILGPYVGAGNVALNELLGLIGLDVQTASYKARAPEMGLDPFGLRRVYEGMPNAEEYMKGRKLYDILSDAVDQNPDLASDPIFNRLLTKAKNYGDPAFIGEWPEEIQKEYGKGKGTVLGTYQPSVGSGERRLTPERIIGAPPIEGGREGEAPIPDRIEAFYSQYRDELIRKAADMGIPENEIPYRADELGISQGLANQMFPVDISYGETISGEESQRRQIEAIRESPMYQTALEEGERAITRHLAGLGQAEGGTASEILGRYAPTLLNQMILERAGQLGTIAGLGAQVGGTLAGGAMNLGSLLNQNAIAQAGLYQQQGTAAAQGALSQWGIGGQMVQSALGIPAQLYFMNRILNRGTPAGGAIPGAGPAIYQSGGGGFFGNLAGPAY